MINYLNIYDQLQMLDTLKSDMANGYQLIIVLGIMLMILIITIFSGILITYMPDEKTEYKNYFISAPRIGLYIICVILTVLIYIGTIKNPMKNKLELKNNNSNIIELYNRSVFKSNRNDTHYKINELLTYNQLHDMLTVNSVSNIDTFKNNINYLKDTYTTKIKTFKVMYGKDSVISEDDYINSILNQFYLGKIDNTPTDITGFEEDYPRVSINLKK